MSEAQILTVAQMQAAEQAIFDTGTSVEDLMEVAAGGAAEWIRRIAAGRSVTVLCGPGNNGGDGYVIARRLREAGNPVTIVAPIEPKTDAAKTAKDNWNGAVLTSGGDAKAQVFIDCLFGSGLARPLSAEHALLLRDLAARHDVRIAIDLPSGIQSDSGALLNDRLPDYDVTLALGAWKFAHCCLPARAMMGVRRLVPIGVDAIQGAAQLIGKPSLKAPNATAHKYTRGLCSIIGGEMPGASVLSSLAAMRAGAGYVKLLTDHASNLPPSLVVESGHLAAALDNTRLSALLVGPGLGRDQTARSRLIATLAKGLPTVVDADALHLLEADMINEGRPIILTPHDGELEVLCKRFAVIAEDRRARALGLARASKMVVCAKGPDSFVAGPDGRLAVAPPAPSWLSVAGTGDVLAGITVSRMASGSEPFDAVCEAVWLHGEAARLSGVAFTADELAHNVAAAYSACL